MNKLATISPRIRNNSPPIVTDFCHRKPFLHATTLRYGRTDQSDQYRATLLAVPTTRTARGLAADRSHVGSKSIVVIVRANRFQPPLATVSPRTRGVRG